MAKNMVCICLLLFSLMLVLADAQETNDNKSPNRGRKSLFIFQNLINGQIIFSNRPEKYRDHKDYKEIPIDKLILPPPKHIPSFSNNNESHSQSKFHIIFHSGLTQPADDVLDRGIYWHIIYGNRVFPVRKDLVKEVICNEIPDSEQEHFSEDNNAMPNAEPSIYPDFDDNPIGSATAFAITSSGYLITAAHAVIGSKMVKVLHEETLETAEIIETDIVNDIALLKAKGTFVPLPLISSINAKLGMEVFTIGYPNIGLQGMSAKLTRGEISSICGLQDNPRYFQISTPIQPGNSGGPLLDIRGNVIGMITSFLDASYFIENKKALPQNVNYAVKSDYLLPLLDHIPDTLKSISKENIAADKVIETTEQATLIILIY